MRSRRASSARATSTELGAVLAGRGGGPDGRRRDHDVRLDRARDPGSRDRDRRARARGRAARRSPVSSSSRAEPDRNGGRGRPPARRARAAPRARRHAGPAGLACDLLVTPGRARPWPCVAGLGTSPARTRAVTGRADGEDRRARARAALSRGSRARRGRRTRGRARCRDPSSRLRPRRRRGPGPGPASGSRSGVSPQIPAQRWVTRGQPPEQLGGERVELRLDERRRLLDRRRLGLEARVAPAADDQPAVRQLLPVVVAVARVVRPLVQQLAESGSVASIWPRTGRTNRPRARARASPVSPSTAIDDRRPRRPPPARRRSRLCLDDLRAGRRGVRGEPPHPARGIERAVAAGGGARRGTGGRADRERRRPTRRRSRPPQRVELPLEPARARLRRRRDAGCRPAGRRRRPTPPSRSSARSVSPQSVSRAVRRPGLARPRS